MDPKVVTVIVTGVVAVGTLLYYLFFDNKNNNKPHTTSRRPPSSGSSSSTTQSYDDIRPSRSRYRSPPPRNRRNDARNTVVSRTDNTVRPEETVTPIVTRPNNSNDLIASSHPAVSNESTEKGRNTSNTGGASTDPISKPSTSDNSTETVSKSPTCDEIFVTHTTDDKSLDSTLPSPSESSVDHSDSLTLSDELAASSSSRAQPRSKSVVKLDRMIKKSCEVQTNVDPANLNPLCLVCAELATTMLQPCEHKVFCGNHAHMYMERAKLYSLNPFCPLNECGEIISGFI